MNYLSHKNMNIFLTSLVKEFKAKDSIHFDFIYITLSNKKRSKSE